MHKPLIIGIGELFWDILPESRYVGGAPVNIVYHASKQGADGCLVSAIGDDEDGYDMRAELHRKGICDKHVATAPAFPTGSFILGPPDDTSCCDFNKPAAWDLVSYTTDLEILASHADAICFGMLPQRKEVTASTIMNMLEDAPKECLKIFDMNMNSGFYSKTAIQNSLRLCNILKLNDEELHFLTDLLELNGNKAVMGIITHRYNLKYIILTRGADGSVLFNGESFVAVPALSYEEEVDDTGCGDAFTAAFVTALLYDVRPADAMLHAAKVAGYVCSHGGNMPEIPPEHRLVIHNEATIRTQTECYNKDRRS